jgi:predicted permease
VRVGRDSVGHASSLRIRRALMIVEVAFAVVLLVGAGLMTRTMRELGSVSTGFDPADLLTLRLNVPRAPSTEPNDDARYFRLYSRILDSVRAVPGVEHAALAQTLPIEGSQWNSVFVVSGQPVPARADLPSAAFSPISTDYVETMKMSVKAGRVFTDRDAASAGTVAIVNESFARRFWPDGNAVGQRIKQGWPETPAPWREIVGVVGDVKINGVDSTTPLEVFLPASQVTFASIAVVVRSRAAEALTKPVSAAVQSVVPDIPIYNVRTMEDLMGAAVSRQAMTMRILGGFAAIALLLACVGLYGVVSHGVSERTREIGVRLALGATRGRVVWLFVGQGLLTTAIGLAIGVGGALSLAEWVSGLLFNVSATDPATFWVTGLVLLTVALLACYLPARRASRVNPTVALRGE